jgi:hypothetical protein
MPKCVVCDALGEQYLKDLNQPALDQVCRKPLKQCGECTSVCYCTKECQVIDWKEHKKVCAILAMKKAMGAEKAAEEAAGAERAEAETK